LSNFLTFHQIVKLLFLTFSIARVCSLSEHGGKPAARHHEKTNGGWGRQKEDDLVFRGLDRLTAVPMYHLIDTQVIEYVVTPTPKNWAAGRWPMPAMRNGSP
jgi:hypothetical protein